ncbi:MAG: hypothetical protein AAFR66_06390 [Bacteroidota bacterium]
MDKLALLGVKENCIFVLFIATKVGDFVHLIGKPFMSIAELLQLSVSERLEIALTLLQSIQDEQAPMSKEGRQVLHDKLTNNNASGTPVIPMSDFKARLKERLEEA